MFWILGVLPVAAHHFEFSSMKAKDERILYSIIICSRKSSEFCWFPVVLTGPGELVIFEKEIVYCGFFAVTFIREFSRRINIFGFAVCVGVWIFCMFSDSGEDYVW